jgi:hypothetical protein
VPSPQEVSCDGGCFLCQHAECLYERADNGDMLIRCLSSGKVLPEVFGKCDSFKKHEKLFQVFQGK